MTAEHDNPIWAQRIRDSDLANPAQTGGYAYAAAEIEYGLQSKQNQQVVVFLSTMYSQ